MVLDNVFPNFNYLDSSFSKNKKKNKGVYAGEI